MKLGLKDYVYVAIQLLLFIAYILDIEIVNTGSLRCVSVVGIVLIIIGFFMILIGILQLNINISPFPSPKTGSSLITNGIFAYVRHPIYGGLVIGLFGYALFFASLYKILIVCLLFVLFMYKSSYEEKRLSILFPIYDTYKLGTKRIIPFIY